MGQKSNPIALRTRQKGRFFDSSWYNDIHYGKAISRDQMIEKYLQSLIKNMRNQNSRFYIQELSKKYILTLFYFKAQDIRKKRSKSLSLRKRRSKKNHPKIGYYINSMGLYQRRPKKKNEWKNNNTGGGKNMRKIRAVLNKNRYLYRNNRNKYFVYLRQKKIEKLNIAKIPEIRSTQIYGNLELFRSRKSLFNIYPNIPLKKGKHYISSKAASKYSSIKQLSLNSLVDKSKMDKDISLKKKNVYALKSCFVKKYEKWFNTEGIKYPEKKKTHLSENTLKNDQLGAPFTNLLTTINTLSNILKKPAWKQPYQQFQSFQPFLTILSSGNRGTHQQMINKPSYLYINKTDGYLKNKHEYGGDIPYLINGFAASETKKKKGVTIKSIKYILKVAAKNLSTDLRREFPTFYNKKQLSRIRYPLLADDNFVQTKSEEKKKQVDPINKVLHTNSLYNHYAKWYNYYKLYQGFKYKKFDIRTKKNKRRLKKNYFQNIKLVNQKTRMHKLFAKNYFRDLVKKKYKQHIPNMLSHIVKSDLILRVRNIKSDYLTANSLAEEIAYYMKRGSRFGQIKNRIIQELEKGMISIKIIGMRISCSGRIGGRSKKALRSRTLGLRNGSVPLNNLTRKIDYCCKKARTRYGIVGIKVWLSYQ